MVQNGDEKRLIDGDKRKVFARNGTPLAGDRVVRQFGLPSAAVSRSRPKGDIKYESIRVLRHTANGEKYVPGLRYG